MLTYVAAPYSHETVAVRQYRFECVTAFAAGLIVSGQVVFSPISHTHYMQVGKSVPGNWDFWRKQSVPFLRLASRLVVLKLPGWEQSEGVAEEVKIAQALSIPIEFIESSEWELCRGNT